MTESISVEGAEPFETHIEKPIVEIVKLNMYYGETKAFTDDESLQSFSDIQREFNQGNNVFSQDLLEQFGEKSPEEIPDNNDSQESENN